MFPKNLKACPIVGSIALMTLGLSLAISFRLNLKNIFENGSGLASSYLEPNWFVGLSALLALLQMLRFAHTHDRSSLVFGVTASLGIWVFQDSDSFPIAAAMGHYIGLPMQQLLLSVAMICAAAWLMHTDHHNTRSIQQAQRAQIQRLQHAVDGLQASRSQLEVTLYQRTQDWHKALLQIEAVSALDALTGLANRRRFDEVIKIEWGRAARSGKALSMALIDVDWLSNYNARYGHEKGDETLCKLVRVLQSGVMRNGDLIARYRGGCFALLAPDTDASGILSIANYLCQEVLELHISHMDSPLGSVSISVGVATSVKPESRKAETLLMRAQAALTLAKSQGRNQVTEA